MKEQIDINRVDIILKPIIGKKAWSVHRGYSSYLVLEFGKEKEYMIKCNKRIVGEYHLWIKDCSWQLTKNNKGIVACNDDDEDIDKTISILEKERLESIIIQPATLNTQMIFGNNVILSLFTDSFIKGHISWLVILPDNKALVFGPKEMISFKDIKKQGD
jgi:hypothetical protein